MGKTLSIEDQCRNAVEEYSGKKVKEIDVVRDPQVSGCVAFRVKFENEKEYICFIKMYSDPITAETIEEAEFETWPPNSGGLKFFV